VWFSAGNPIDDGESVAHKASPALLTSSTGLILDAFARSARIKSNTLTKLLFFAHDGACQKGASQRGTLQPRSPGSNPRPTAGHAAGKILTRSVNSPSRQQC